MDKFIAILKIIDDLDDEMLAILQAAIASGHVPAALRPYAEIFEKVLNFLQKIEEVLAGFGLLKTTPRFVGGLKKNPNA